MRKKHIIILAIVSLLTISCNSEIRLTTYVNPFLGTATLWEPEDLGYVRTWKQRTWGAEVFPGSSLPNAMVQLSPVTQFRSGAGYQYEDSVIYGFAHISPCCRSRERSRREIMPPLSVMITNRPIRDTTGYFSKHTASTRN